LNTFLKKNYNQHKLNSVDGSVEISHKTYKKSFHSCVVSSGNLCAGYYCHSTTHESVGGKQRKGQKKNKNKKQKQT
jgi:hypothetical protein